MPIINEHIEKANRITLKKIINKTSVTLSHQFEDATARDAYFVTNLTELQDNLFIKVGTGYQQYLNDAWADVSAVLVEQAPASLQRVEDVGEHYTSDNVEGVLQEVGEQINDLDANVVHGKDVTTNAQTDGVNTTFGHSSNKIADDISTSVIIGGGSTGYNNVIGGDGANVGTTTPNTTKPGTNAHVSVIGGYDNSAGSLSSKIISDHSKTEEGGDGHNAIYGGAKHIIKSTASYAMIAGGQSNEVSGQGGFATGLRNKVAGTGSACFGYDNTLNANGDFANGAANTINGTYAQANGSTNTANGNFSKAEGNYAHTRSVGQQALATGKFANLGDAQTSVLQMYRQTTDETTVTLGMMASNTSHVVLNNQAVAFNALVIARDIASNDTASWEIKGSAMRTTAGLNIVGTPIITDLGKINASTWTIAVTGGGDGTLNVRITGKAGKTIRWVQKMTLVEVMI